jgi:hypothetical protein
MSTREEEGDRSLNLEGEKKIGRFDRTHHWYKEISKYLKYVYNIIECICQAFFDPFESRTFPPQRARVRKKQLTAGSSFRIITASQLGLFPFR